MSSVENRQEDPRLHPLVRRPAELCRKIEEKFPHILRFIERRRVDLAKTGTWPRWAYAPTTILDEVMREYSDEILEQSFAAIETSSNLANFVENVSDVISLFKPGIDRKTIEMSVAWEESVAYCITAVSLAAWRFGGKHVFVMHDELYDALLDSQMPSQEIPLDILTQLPYWGGYIPLVPFKHFHGSDTGYHEPNTNKETVETEHVYGILFALMWKPPDKGTKSEGAGELFIVFDGTESESGELFVTERIPLTERKSIEALLTEKLKEELASSSRSQSNASQLEPFYYSVVSQASYAVTRAINPILYLCAVNSEARLATPIETSAPPRPRKPAQQKLYAPQQETIWAVGYRIGAAIRAARAERTDAKQNIPGAPSSRVVRPHIRRAHWHGYRVGPGRTGWKVIWLPPIPVKMDLSEDETITPDQLPVTQRAIEEQKTKKHTKKSLTQG